MDGPSSKTPSQAAGDEVSKALGLYQATNPRRNDSNGGRPKESPLFFLEFLSPLLGVFCVRVFRSMFGLLGLFWASFGCFGACFGIFLGYLYQLFLVVLSLLIILGLVLQALGSFERQSMLEVFLTIEGFMPSIHQTKSK